VIYPNALGLGDTEVLGWIYGVWGLCPSGVQREKAKPQKLITFPCMNVSDIVADIG